MHRHWTTLFAVLSRDRTPLLCSEVQTSNLRTTPLVISITPQRNTSVYVKLPLIFQLIKSLAPDLLDQGIFNFIKFSVGQGSLFFGISKHFFHIERSRGEQLSACSMLHLTVSDISVLHATAHIDTILKMRPTCLKLKTILHVTVLLRDRKP